ncbi:hypothetical protein [Levilactobacillus zymae]|uniref:hypothetical protein n=1 Tax=Levilactobacillus zymae TaxID=267363 RepID=UPI0028BC29B0|nr:hypothetical protein [Levilactobacillus zymae]MDT6979538.1 hypothetical protein [Levilactobacillus zymae]
MTNTSGAAVPGTGGTNLATGTNSISFSGNYLKINVDFSNLNDFRLAMPMDFGFIIKTSDGSKTMSYYLGQNKADSSSPLTIADVWEGGSISSSGQILTQTKKLTVNSTYSQSITTLANIKSSDTSITGYNAYTKDNLTIWAAPKGIDGTTKVYKGTINSDGTFQIDFPQALGLLTNTTVISVFETNDMGDLVASAASLKNVLDITSDKSSIDVYPDDLTDNISGKSDNDVLSWLVKQAGVSVSLLGTTLNNSDLTFSADKSNLADIISNLNDGGSTTITISAKNSAGVATDGGVAITVTKHNGQIEFGTIGDLDFGLNAVPTKTTLLAPKSAIVNVNDTRTVDSKWSVTAEASPVTNGTRSINGLVYKYANGNEEPMTNQAVLVASGSRAKGVNTVNAADDWATTSNEKQSGIYFKAGPTIYSGDSGTTYTGTVTWRLYDTPDAN